MELILEKGLLLVYRGENVTLNQCYFQQRRAETSFTLECSDPKRHFLSLWELTRKVHVKQPCKVITKLFHYTYPLAIIYSIRIQ